MAHALGEKAKKSVNAINKNIFQIVDQLSVRKWRGELRIYKHPPHCFSPGLWMKVIIFSVVLSCWGSSCVRFGSFQAEWDRKQSVLKGGNIYSKVGIGVKLTSSKRQGLKLALMRRWSMGLQTSVLKQWSQSSLLISLPSPPPPAFWNVWRRACVVICS